jgi:hypothetical protein
VVAASATLAAILPAYAQQAICNPTAPLSAAWQHTAMMLEQAFSERGDIDGAQQARAFVWQMAHAPPLPSGWQHAEASLTQAFLERGDIEGARRVRGYLLDQMRDVGVPVPAPTCPPGTQQRGR